MAQTLESFLGTWKIEACVIDSISSASQQEETGIEGTVMTLNENGDVTWSVPSGAEDLPLFYCLSYDVFYSATSAHIRFGAYYGHIIQFLIDQNDALDYMLMTCEDWCMLKCRKVATPEPSERIDATFSLLPALEEGYFSDLNIVASNEKKFAVHSCIVRLGAPELDWQSVPPPLTGLQEDVLATTLHFLYAECLPTNLSPSTARQCVTVAQTYPCLQPLSTMCQHYLRNMALKHQIVTLVNDMHTCASHIIQRLVEKSVGDSVSNNPAKLCFILRQSARDIGVAVSKVLLLCDLYSQRQEELTREQRHEVIRYAKSRLPVFMNQLKRFLLCLKSMLSSLSTSQRQGISTCLVPEVESLLEALSSLAMKKKTGLETVITTFNETSPSYGHCSLILRTFHEMIQQRELARLKNLLQRHTRSLYLLIQRKDGFAEMTSGNRVRSLSRSLDQLIEELPVFLLRYDEVASAIEDKLEWREFKFCFKVGCSKVSGLLHRLRKHHAVMEPVLTELCTIVARDSFTQALTSLGLFDATKIPPHENNHSSSDCHASSQLCGCSNASLNLVECLCGPPSSHNSGLSKAALKLLRSASNTDMVFEIISSPEGSEGTSEGEEVFSISAHRVIVAARCDWFCRALLSGMREDIDRKIVVYDTTPAVFSLLLDYLYCGQIDTKALSADNLADLLLLADRYQLDSLKTCCEQGLNSHVDHDSVLYFLSMADQFNAKWLRKTCLNFIKKNPDIMDSELFEELHQNLQAEVYDQVIWAYAPSKEAEKAGTVQEATNMQLSQSPESADDDSAKLEACLQQLRDVIGENAASRQHLVRVALAADFDLNRALNFYYSS